MRTSWPIVVCQNHALAEAGTWLKCKTSTLDLGSKVCLGCSTRATPTSTTTTAATTTATATTLLLLRLLLLLLLLLLLRREACRLINKGCAVHGGSRCDPKLIHGLGSVTPGPREASLGAASDSLILIWPLSQTLPKRRC